MEHISYRMGRGMLSAKIKTFCKNIKDKKMTSMRQPTIAILFKLHSSIFRFIKIPKILFHLIDLIDYSRL